MANGQIINNSSRTLWVVVSNSTSSVAHRLDPNLQSPSAIDADGVRCVDPVPINGHRSWVKIPDIATATVRDRGANLTTDSWTCRYVGDSEFGTVTFSNATGWGEPIR